MNDEIIQELWQIKDAMAAECKNNLNELAKQLRHREKENRDLVVNLSSQRKKS